MFLLNEFECSNLLMYALTVPLSEVTRWMLWSIMSIALRALEAVDREIESRAVKLGVPLVVYPWLGLPDWETVKLELEVRVSVPITLVASLLLAVPSARLWGEP